MYHPILRPGAQQKIKKIGKADLVVGLPSYKNSQIAARVAQAALAGLHQHYPDLRGVLINADAGLKGATRKAVALQASSNGHNNLVVCGRYNGLLGWGSAVAALLDAALALDARAIVILDTQTASALPTWIPGLAHLILADKADLVVPRYRRPWPLPDGLVTDLIIYPLFRALWGQNLRRPAAPDFAMSPSLATMLLDEDIWGTAAAGFGLPSWLAAYGRVNQWRIAQSALGTQNDWPPKPSPLKPLERIFNTRFANWFQDVLTVLFNLAHHYEDVWQRVNRVQSLPTLTHFSAEASLPQQAHPALAASFTEEDAGHLLDNLALGWIEYRALWQRVLTAKNLTQIETLAALPADRFHFPSDLWAKIIYDFVVVFNKGDADPAQIVASLFPLFQGRLAAFQQEIAGLAPVGREGTVAAQAVEFEEARNYLQERWQTYQLAP